MGVRVTIAGKIYEAENYTVSEDSTPTSSDDSSGSVGTITFNIPGVEDPHMLVGEEVTLKDSRRGSTLGYVVKADEADFGGVTVQCNSRLGRLNIYNVQAQPFVGNMLDAFRYYAGLANQTVDVIVDPELASNQVVFPGWYGELWFHLKQLAAAQDCEIALVSDVILLRPLRKREAIDHRNISRTRSYGGTTLARAVEVYVYQNRAIENELIYPVGGWTPETEVLTVGAGESIEVDITLGASISYFQPPVMQTFVSQSHSTSSVYTIVGDDGFPVEPAQWSANGGRVEFSINPDTTTIKVSMHGASNISGDKGEALSTFSLALGSDVTGNRYSTLRIVGTGVAFNKETVRCRTTVPDHLTGTDIGITIDNPFISTWGDAYSAGTRAARWYAGEKMILQGSVTSINRLGDSGAANYPKYQFDQDNWQGETYARVQDAEQGRTYREIQESYYQLTRDDFNNQVFGNVGGVRIWDRKSRRWFRSRSGTISQGDISFSAEDDLTYEDFQKFYGGIPYRLDRELFSRLSYSERDREGLSWADLETVPDDYFPSLTRYPGYDIFPGGI